MSTYKKATVESIIDAKLVTPGANLVEIDAPSVEMTFVALKMPLTKVLRIIDNTEDPSSVLGNYEFLKKIIYESVPVLKDKKLLQHYECVEPTDIVEKVFDNNASAISEFGRKILALYGLDELPEMLKN